MTTPTPVPEPAPTVGAMWTRDFWMDVAERALATAAEVAVAYFGTVALVEDFQASWDTALLSVGIATALSILKSIAATRFGDRQTASLVK